MTFSSDQLSIIRYCAEECQRQRSGEVSVADMLDAWNWAYLGYQEGEILSINFILGLGKLVEPKMNANGFRTHPVGISDGFTVKPIGSPHEKIEQHLQYLLDSYFVEALMPTAQQATSEQDQFYFEYERIHPFGDGNGRTGKIIYNYLCGTLATPIMPPNFFGGDVP